VIFADFVRTRTVVGMRTLRSHKHKNNRMYDCARKVLVEKGNFLFCVSPFTCSLVGFIREDIQSLARMARNVKDANAMMTATVVRTIVRERISCML